MIPRSSLRTSRRAFTLMEVMVAATMLGVIMVASLFGFISLQKSYAAAEEYGTGLADQMRLMDFLAQDLRRATTPPTMDADGQGVQITVPDYYRFNASDPQHLFSIVNDAQINSTGTAAIYYDPAAPHYHHADDRVPLRRGLDHAAGSPGTAGSEFLQQWRLCRSRPRSYRLPHGRLPDDRC